MADLTKKDEAGSQAAEKSGEEAQMPSDCDIKVVYKFRDTSGDLVEAWNKIFGEKPYFESRIEVSKGDIFRGAPSADAIVSPANSFGFMDGGIDAAYSYHYGWGMSERLRKHIAEDYDGELLVGQAAIILTNVKGEQPPPSGADITGGQHIKWLISAPTMRVPMKVADTANAYLAFRGVILAVKRHNKDPTKEPIRSVLCPGLGTSVGFMPKLRCAFQMMHAFERFDLGLAPEKMRPAALTYPWGDHSDMAKYSG